jgi:uncharacterized protein
MFSVELFFAEELRFFLAREHRVGGQARRVLKEKTAVKDMIESCGVPHPEVDLIVLSGEGLAQQAVDFRWSVQTDVRLEIFGVPAPAAILPGAPRLQRSQTDRFVADGHLGKLARNLRLLGIDTAYEREADDCRLLEISASECRALLTRDRRLLMHSIVETGYCPRSHDPDAQTLEVLRRFGFDGEPGKFASFSRCLHCNGLLAAVRKDDVLEALADQPLTLKFYHEFRRCAECGRVFWSGSHFQKLAARIEKLTGCAFAPPVNGNGGL